MMDMRQGIKGKINKNYRTQISDMKNLRDRYPGKILPFIAIDPNNPQATDIFIKAFSEDNFFGVKIYPSLGYLPTHPILMDIFRICEEKNIPIVTHCGGAEVRNSHKILKNVEGIEYNHNKTGEFIKIDKNRTKFLPTKNDYKYYFNNPINWYPVLKSFPKLRLNFAHFGSTEEWVKLAKGKNNSWVLRIMDFMYNFEYVYADLSFNIFEQKLYDFVRKKIEDNKILREKTLYGSDWYMIATKGHFRNIKTNFITSMGDGLMEDISRNNPLRFFGI